MVAETVAAAGSRFAVSLVLAGQHLEEDLEDLVGSDLDAFAAVGKH